MIINFIKKTLFFLIIPAIACLLGLVAVNFAHIEKMSHFKMDPQVNTVFMGDSHLTLTINDEMLENGVNFSQTAETYYFTYYKLKKILIKNPQVKKVYLGYGYHSLSDYRDERFLQKTPTYFFVLPPEEQLDLLIANFEHLPTYILKVLKTGTVDVLADHTPDFVGGYNNIFEKTAADKNIIKERLEYHFIKEGKVRGFSKRNMLYLKKMKELAQEKEVELILFKTPLHPLYYKNIPEIFAEKHHEVIQLHNFEVLDYSRLKMKNASFIPDGDHVSQSGATIVTKKLLGLEAD